MVALLFVSKGWQGTTAVLSPAGRPQILNFNFLKRGCVLNIQALLTISILFSLKLPVEENPRPPPAQTVGEGGAEELAGAVQTGELQEGLSRVFHKIAVEHPRLSKLGTIEIYSARGNRGQRSRLSSLAAVLVPGVELRLPALVSGALTCRVTSLSSEMMFHFIWFFCGTAIH